MAMSLTPLAKTSTELPEVDHILSEVRPELLAAASKAALEASAEVASWTLRLTMSGVRDVGFRRLSDERRFASRLEQRHRRGRARMRGAGAVRGGFA